MNKINIGNVRSQDRADDAARLFKEGKISEEASGYFSDIACQCILDGSCSHIEHCREDALFKVELTKGTIRFLCTGCLLSGLEILEENDE